MKIISSNEIREAVASLCQKANFELSQDVRDALAAGAQAETRPLAKSTLFRILQNADVAAAKQVPMCQDTGLVVVFADVGQDVHLQGGTLSDAVNEGVRQGYREGFLRASVSPDPIVRGNTGDNTPAVLHVRLVLGDGLRLSLLAKGGGCENMSAFRMLTPADGVDAVTDFVVETAVLAGPNACPPIIVGVGIGGSFELSAVLAKRALLRRIGDVSPLPHVAGLEQRIAQRINASGIGPQGYGGQTTALSVQIEAAPCHIASLPVSVNIECHAHRHQEALL